MFCYALLLLFLGTQVLQPNCGYESRADVPFSRILADALRMKYRRRKGENKTVIHWGQRKLFMSELEFLTEYGTPNTTVVYAGAAPGTHTRYLIDLFPDLKFVLVDPAPFSSKLSEGPRCFLRQELFTDEVAREFEGLDNVLFLCDIRSCDWSNMDDAAVEDKVLEDMLAQQQWHDIIKPRKSMLKFRLPWTPGQTEYLAGDVYLQAFGPITTTETRLIPHGHDRTLWDNKQYEEQMFYFNTVTRYFYFIFILLFYHLVRLIAALLLVLTFSSFGHDRASNSLHVRQSYSQPVCHRLHDSPQFHHSSLHGFHTIDHPHRDLTWSAWLAKIFAVLLIAYSSSSGAAHTL
jgi:hypothetical protein